MAQLDMYGERGRGGRNEGKEGELEKGRDILCLWSAHSMDGNPKIIQINGLPISCGTNFLRCIMHAVF